MLNLENCHIMEPVIFWIQNVTQIKKLQLYHILILNFQVKVLLDYKADVNIQGNF
jgi:hypothetical protein